MIKLQRSTDRRYIRTRSRETWMTFDPGNVADPFHGGFRALGLLNEVKLRPGTEVSQQAHQNHESVIYVREGGLVVRHGPRSRRLLGPELCPRPTLHPLMAAGATHEPRSQGAHLFVSSMTPLRTEGRTSCEFKHYPFSGRHGHLQLIASPDGSDASLRLQQDVRIYSSALDRGHHVILELRPGRGVWLHVVAGRIRLIDQSLGAGDGASLDNEPAVSFTAQEASEILVFDLA